MCQTEANLQKFQHNHSISSPADRMLVIQVSFHLSYACSWQAYMTRRKGNKTLMVYDLSVTLNWSGKLAEEDSQGRCMASIRCMAMYEFICSICPTAKQNR